MNRILFQYLLPLLLPLAGYVAYVWWRHRHADTPPAIEKTHVLVALITGFLLMLGGLVWVASTTGESPGQGYYESPRLEDGRITVPTFK